MFHESYFSATAEWHYFVTAHGKILCDSVRRVLKKSTTRANLRKLLLTTYQNFKACTIWLNAVCNIFT